MATIEPLIKKILYVKKVLTKEELLEEIKKDINIEKEKILFRIDKLISQGKIYPFQEKGIALMDHGDMLEDRIESEMRKIFFESCVFRSPKLSNGKELCDVLIYFNNVLILFQAKTSKFEGDYNRFIKNTVFTSTSQLKTSINRCKNENYDIELIDTKGRKIKIDKTNLKHIYGVVVAYQVEPILSHDKARLTFFEKNQKIKELPHIISDDELSLILNYINTPLDFIDYLDKREYICKNPNHHLISEKDLIAIYYLSNRTMLPEKISRKEYEKANLIIWDGFEEELESGELHKKLEKRKEDDKHSYLVDHLIKSIEPRTEDFNDLEIINHFQNMRRIDRRFIGDSLYNKFTSCIKDKRDFSYRVILNQEKKEIVYLGIFSKLEFEETNKRASALLKILKAKWGIEKAMAIIFHNYLDKDNVAYGFILDNTQLSLKIKEELIKDYGKFFGDQTKEKFYEFI